MKKVIIALGVIILIGGIYFASTSENKKETEIKGPKTVTMYKSPTCGCCDNYAKYLERKGYQVNIKNVADMSLIKTKYNIPSSVLSCHTIDFGDYVVEGHVPLEAIDKLFTENPDVKGIGMPGMPAGSPGMGGSKKGPFEVYSIDEQGQIEKFASI